ncbi:unnamed protein product [Jaminaea pallidilutea]
MVPSTAPTSKTVLNDAFPGIEGQSPTPEAARQSILTSSRPPLRTLAWLCFFDLLPIDDDRSWRSKLQQSHDAYEKLKSQHCRKPDGSWIAELSLPSEGDAQGSSSSQTKDHSTVGYMHPLGQGDSHPWQQYYMALASLEQIQLDVSRHTEIDGAVAQVAIARILFLWAKEHPVIAYRQGMHELVAALWIVRCKEASTCDLVDSKHIEHDTYALFDLLMVRLRPLYEWKTQSPPILKITQDIRSQLASVDPALSTHLADVEFQLFTLRWLRLLFLREVPMDIAVQLWDVCFSHADNFVELLEWVCVALLIRTRSHLLAQDPLLVLMRPLDETMVSQPHLLVRQALSLRSNPAPAAGVQCVIENNRQLGIEIYNPRASQEDVASPTQASAATNLPSVRQLYAQKLASQLPRAAYQGAAWAYANAYQGLASARAAVDDDPSRGGFPSGWGQRQQRGPTGAATAETEICRYRERDASLAAALDTVVASLQEERSSSSSSSSNSTVSVADRQKHSFNDSLTALIMVRDSLLGRVNANDTVNALKSLALNEDESRGGRRSPERPAAQKLSTPPAPESSPRTAQPKIHRAFQRMPSPPRAPQSSRPVPSSSDLHSRSPQPSPSPQGREDTSNSPQPQRTAPTKTTSQGRSVSADDDPLGVGGGR